MFYRTGVGLRVRVIYVPSLSWLVAEPELNSRPDPIPDHGAALIGRDVAGGGCPAGPAAVLGLHSSSGGPQGCVSV